MTEAEFFSLVRSVRKRVDRSVLDLGFDRSPFDSLDLLHLRCALEERLGRRLSDEKFVASSSLRDLYHLVRA